MARGPNPARQGISSARDLLNPIKFGGPDFTWLLEIGNLKPPQIMA